MVAQNPGRSSRGLRRRSRRGFSLVELGIVIAVIAVLAAVVIFGRGFIQSARVTKAVDACNTSRKGAATFAGVQGGLFRTTGNQMPQLTDRGLIPALSGVGNAAVWLVSGNSATDLANSIIVQQIGVGQINRNGLANAVRVQISVPNGTMATDLVSAVRDDPNYFNGTAGGTTGPACTEAAFTSATPGPVTVNLCFFL
jgi:prepilin-type N-terminal cleavage/methylation domain-containing protein